MSEPGPSAAPGPAGRSALPRARGSGRQPGALPVALLVAALALGVRVWHRTISVAIGSDGPVFLRLAREASEGDWAALLSHPYHPLYPLAIAAVHELGVELESAAAAVSIVSGSAAALLLFLFLRSAFGLKTAAIGSALLAVNSYAASFSSDVLSEGLYLGLLMGGVLALWHALKSERAGPALAAGALGGLAYLTRPEGLVVAAAGVGLAGLRALGRARRGPALRIAGAVALGSALFVTPYVLVLRVQHGVLLLTPKKSVSGLLGVGGVIPESLAEAHAPPFLRRIRTASVPAEWDPPGAERDPPGAEWDPPVAERGPPAAAAADRPAEAEAQPAAPAAARFEQLPAAPPPEWPHPALRHLAALREVVDRAGSAAPWEVVPFLVLGVVALRGRPGLRGRLVLGLVGVYGAALYALAFSAGYLSRRHGLPPVVISLGYAAVGLSTAADWLGDRLGSVPRALGPLSRIPRRAVLALLLAALAAGSFGRIGTEHRGHRRAEREAAEWVAGRLAEGEAVAARRERVAYYAGAPYVTLSYAPRENFTGYLRHLGVRYVIVDESKIDRYPGLRREAESLSRLRAVERAGRRVVVFEVPARGDPARPVAGAAGNR